MASIIEVPSAEIARNFGLWQDKALTEPVIVTRHGRARVVLVSADHYEAMGRPRPSAPTLENGLLDALSSAMVAVDDQGRITFANRSFLLLVDIPPADLVGELWSKVAPAGFGLVTEHLHRTIKTGEEAEFETDPASFPGRIYGVRTVARPRGAAIILTSLTQQRELQGAAEDAEALCGALAGQPDIATGAINLRGYFNRADQAMSRLTGLPMVDLRAARLPDIVRPADRRPLLDRAEAVLRGGPDSSLPVTVLGAGVQDAPCIASLSAIRRNGLPAGAVVVLVRRCEGG